MDRSGGITGRTFTPEELAQYDGTNENPAYVAYRGIVYDVSRVVAWSGGRHQGHLAGIDVTEALSRSPHGAIVLSFLPVVGTLII